jgi:hypothetical protein
MSAGKPRFDLGDMKDDEVDIPSAPLVSRPVVEEQGSAPAQKVRGMATKPSILEPTVESRMQLVDAKRFTDQQHDERSIVDLAVSNFAPTEKRTKTSMSLPESLDNLLNSKVYELKARGFKKITREAVVEEALKKFFGVAT